ncbi:sulfotransferase family [Fragilaria crotonensis]|nr:sulfotransferase family [Fragilaria crotonensis]
MTQASVDDANSSTRKRRYRNKRSLAPQSIKSYLGFGSQSTACMGCFLTLYALIMVCILPMLQIQPATVPLGPLEGVNFPLPQESKERLKEVATKVRAKLRNLRQGIGVSDEALLIEAAAEFSLLKAKKRDAAPLSSIIELRTKETRIDPETPGVIVLGMHRSGTSMLSGLLVNGIGYKVGGPLIVAAFDNAKGFFERIDVVLQNDEFLQSQNIWWAAGVRDYDSERAYKEYKAGSSHVYHAEDMAPPFQEAACCRFTYRHPLEVAMSLKKRERDFTLEHGLRLWIIYNRRAVENSAGMCRVLSSNDKVLANPLGEVQRIADELTSRCRMPPGPSRIQQAEVDKFIDPDLQHNKKELASETNGVRILEERNGCIVKDYQSDLVEGTLEKKREMNTYMAAMALYCDFESGDAYKPDYIWPELPK